MGSESPSGKPEASPALRRSKKTNSQKTNRGFLRLQDGGEMPRASIQEVFVFSCWGDWTCPPCCYVLADLTGSDGRSERHSEKHQGKRSGSQESKDL